MTPPRRELSLRSRLRAWIVRMQPRQVQGDSRLFV
jgi:hypothetical protein